MILSTVNIGTEFPRIAVFLPHSSTKAKNDYLFNLVKWVEDVKSMRFYLKYKPRKH